MAQMKLTLSMGVKYESGRVHGYRDLIIETMNTYMENESRKKGTAIRKQKSNIDKKNMKPLNKYLKNIGENRFSP